ETLGNLPQSDFDSDYLAITPLDIGETATINWKWELPIETGNDVQGDRLSFTINYSLSNRPVPTPTPTPTPTPPAESMGGGGGAAFPVVVNPTVRNFNNTTTKNEPNLYIMMMDSPDPAIAGENITYTISYGNNGNAPARNMIITDKIPERTIFVSASRGGIESDATVTWNLGILNAGDRGSVKLVVRLDPNLIDEATITNDSYSIRSNETNPIEGKPVTTTAQGTGAPPVTLTPSPIPTTTPISEPTATPRVSAWFLGLSLSMAMLAGLLLFFVYWLRRPTRIYGLVLNTATGLPIEGSEVVLADNDGIILTHVSTKAAGNYGFRNLNRGEHSLTVSHPEYQTLTTSASRSKNSLEIHLDKHTKPKKSQSVKVRKKPVKSKEVSEKDMKEIAENKPKSAKKAAQAKATKSDATKPVKKEALETKLEKPKKTAKPSVKKSIQAKPEKESEVAKKAKVETNKPPKSAKS
ncbi:MAG: DUF11 domain-containing protein, partial [Planctomycetes bacterium]|nr:DUF11 domain-containing protein [Planctomycetota bacterium]